MTKKLFRTLKITCLCMALTAALPIVSFADEQTAAVKEDKMVVKIIHLDENGNPLEADKQTETETAKEETESSEKTTDTEEQMHKRQQIILIELLYGKKQYHL